MIIGVKVRVDGGGEVGIVWHMCLNGRETIIRKPSKLSYKDRSDIAKINYHPQKHK